MAVPLSIEDQIVTSMRRITRALDSRSRALLNQHGLTSPQLATLQAVARLESATAGSIAREVHLGQPTLTGILDRLERRGLVQRTRGEKDRRSVFVRITEIGRQILALPPDVLQDPFRSRLAELRDWEQAMILSALQRLADMLDAPRISTSTGSNATASHSPTSLPDARAHALGPPTTKPSSAAPVANLPDTTGTVRRAPGAP